MNKSYGPARREFDVESEDVGGSGSASRECLDKLVDFVYGGRNEECELDRCEERELLAGHGGGIEAKGVAGRRVWSPFIYRRAQTTDD